MADDYDAETMRILDLVDGLRPRLLSSGTDWILETDEVQALIEETTGDLRWLAWELNEQGDRCALMWVPVDHGLGESE